MNFQERSLKLIERYDEILGSAEKQAIAIINRALAESFLNLESEIRKKYPSLQRNGSLTAVQRKLLLLQELKDLLNFVEGKPVYLAQFEELLKLSNGQGLDLAHQLLSVMAGNDFIQAVGTVPIEAVRFAAEEQLRYLNRWGEDFALRASEIVTQGIIQGWGVQRLMGPLREQLGVTKVRAEMIARTATISAFNTAIHEHYRANGVSLWQFVATGDDRLCLYCGARNGNIYRLDDTRPPLHPRCRCFAMPVRMEWFKSGQIDEKWIQNFHDRGLAELRAQGKEPNYGLAPFEKSNGLERPPRPVWTPRDGFLGD